MPATPTGKTVRPSRKVVNTKMYVDLSGFIEEASVYHAFHYYISAMTAEGYSYFRGLRLKSEALMGLAKIFAESGTPHTVQIDGEGALTNEVATDWFVSKQIHVGRVIIEGNLSGWWQWTETVKQVTAGWRRNKGLRQSQWFTRGR
jgi:hypothetical protein